MKHTDVTFEEWLCKEEDGVSNEQRCMMWIEELISRLQTNAVVHDRWVQYNRSALTSEWARITMHLRDVSTLEHSLVYLFYKASVVRRL